MLILTSRKNQDPFQLPHFTYTSILAKICNCRNAIRHFMLRTVRFFLVTRTQAGESDAPPGKSGRPIPHKFASRLRSVQNSLYKKITPKAHQYDTRHAEHSTCDKLCHVSEEEVCFATMWLLLLCWKRRQKNLQ